MRRRMLGIVASLVLATFGTVVLVGYVQSAHDKAVAGEPTETVMVVTKPILQGTKVADLKDYVTAKELPVSATADGALADLDALEGKVVKTDLHPGEQLLAARFGDPAELGREGVPPDLLEVTVRLAPERALGGALKPGDTVAVLASFDTFEPAAADLPAGPGSQSTPKTTKVILQKVLVTAVQTSDAKVIEEASKSEDEKTDDAGQNKAAPKPSPAGEFLITLATDEVSVERIIFVVEHGSLWLSMQPKDSPEASNIQTRRAIYE